MRILVVDDDRECLESLSEVLSYLGHQTTICETAEQALKLYSENPFPIVITDIRMPGMDGINFIKHLKSMPVAENSDVVICTGYGDMETAISAIRIGAYDYLHKPINVKELMLLIERIAEHQALKQENRELTFKFDQKIEEVTETLREDLNQARRALKKVIGIGEIIAFTPEMQKLVSEAKLYHENPSVPVMIEGETGVGKEVIARLIHYGDGDIDTPFIDINCATIPSELFESELFGYEAGAFTGSSKHGGRGKLELANGGTLLLDEIGDMPLHLQPKLLRVLDKKTYYRVGGVKKMPFNTRIICSTNRDLKEMVTNGAFRRDLYHRLNVGHIWIPPLRERKKAIQSLAELFLKRESLRKKKNFKKIDPLAMKLLKKLNWPGNVRELENVIERAVLASDGEILTIEHLTFLQNQEEENIAIFSSQYPANPDDLIFPEGEFNLQKHCNNIIKKAVDMFDGNKTQAAKYLGLSRSALRRRLENL